MRPTRYLLDFLVSLGIGAAESQSGRQILHYYGRMTRGS